MADCVNHKVDSNTVGLSFAEEVCAKQLPNLADDGHDPFWYGLEPNSFDDNFGGDITTLARKPINKNRRNKKGTTVDLDAAAPFNIDFTQHNLNRLLQGFFFSNFREKPTTKPMNDDQITVNSAATSSDRFLTNAGLLDRGFRNGSIILVTGPTLPANAGTFIVDEVGDAYIGVTANLADETFTDEVIITVVGHVMADEDTSIVISGGLPVLTLATAPVAATGALTIASGQNAVAAETVTIGDIVYTWRAAAAAPYEVTIGGSRVVSAVNLRKAINGDVLGTPAHPQFSATDNGAGVVTVTALVKGVNGNGFALTETMTQGSWAAATSLSGTGFSFLEMGYVDGEWIFVGGDATETAFVNNVGYARIKAQTDQTLTFDKTTWTPVAEAAPTDSTIYLYTGSVLKDEDFDSTFKATHYYQFERTLGEDADGPQAEYVRGCVANELTINAKLADKIDVDLNFMGSDTSTRTGAEGLKIGTRYDELGEDAFNTASDIVRINMAVIDPATSVPTSLFAYATEAQFGIANNAEAVKVLGALGGIDVSSGNFDVTGTATCLFTTVEAIRAVRQNADVTFDMINAKLNHGFVFDLPLVSIGGAKPKIEENKPITLPINLNGADNPNSYTVMYVTFDYLPDVAMPENDDTDD